MTYQDNRCVHDVVHVLHIFFSGLLNQSGATFKELKRLTLQSMRDFGVGKATIEEKILDETEELVRQIDQHHGRYHDFSLTFNKAVTNIICAVLFNKR